MTSLQYPFGTNQRIHPPSEHPRPRLHQGVMKVYSYFNSNGHEELGFPNQRSNEERARNDKQETRRRRRGSKTENSWKKRIHSLFQVFFVVAKNGCCEIGLMCFCCPSYGTKKYAILGQVLATRDFLAINISPTK